MTTRSKAEAFALLEETREFYVNYAKWLAREICMGDDGTTVFRSVEVQHALESHPGLVHAKLVRDEMEARGLFDGYAGSMTWVGAVFRGKVFVPEHEAGEFMYEDETRNIHDKRLYWWRISDHSAAGELAEPTEPKSYAHARGKFRENSALAYGSNVHRELALETALVLIREHALAHKKERETVKSGKKIEPAASPVLLPGQIEWLLKMTEVVAR